jgi:hypothetical protein
MSFVEKSEIRKHDGVTSIMNETQRDVIVCRQTKGIITLRNVRCGNRLIVATRERHKHTHTQRERERERERD